MAFSKRHWLYASVGLVVLLCVALGVFLVWRANQPVELKTVYALPEPNPERPEILKRALQPPKRAYVAKASNKEATTGNATAESLEADSGESSSQENELEDEGLESMLAAIDEENIGVKGDFPPIPEGYLDDNPKPVWLDIPGYRKGDMTNHENIARVLIKLWNQGERGFRGGFMNHSNNRVYPLYPDVLYVEWADRVIDNQDGNPPVTFRSIAASAGTEDRDFELEDFTVGGWESKFPGLKFVEFKDAGYNPATFLSDED
ncbi:MAG: hypothetical protein OXT74_17865 [Candidatus Poribacteria bacterium]|nr:hypothetical protein [Candidatus Poribacteria bacterium]